MKAYALIIFTLFTLTGYSQTTINNYKYVLVPERFEFSKEDDQYGLNTVAKLLLEEKGFTAFVGNSGLPPEVATNKCNALKAEVTQKKGLFSTNLTLVLKDCQDNIIFKSKEGKSREKEFPIAYNLALRDAFSSLNDVPYKYDGAIATQAQATTPAPAPVSAPAPAQVPAAPPASVTIPTGTLYAQTTPTGYQLIDTTPKKVLTLFKTSAQDYFIAEDGTTNGIVFKKDSEWLLEYYKDGKLVSQKLEIKF
ncbi:hypothetical protein [Chitinophaga tropicalis]|uniref:Uncharacterized protein n=1 Tax=Chitinophaga tropicalis TaxID=2683588 RepID=A0A7K1U2A6_9BACT|nr:hypothetical protein [Chitinophaga tropicalis]MVT08406.1 hypothetical protein [Chitinophaga tropicalis]